MLHLLRPALRAIVVSLALLTTLQVAAQEPLPIPSEPIDPDNIVAVEHPYSIVVFADATHQDFGTGTAPDVIAASLQADIVFSWADVLAKDAADRIDAIVIHPSALSAVDSEWLTEGYWQRGLVVAGLNIDKADLYNLVGLGHCEANPIPDRVRAGSYFISKSRLIVADIEVEAVSYTEHARQYCENQDGREAEANEPIIQGYLAELTNTWAFPLMSVDDVGLFASLVVQDLSQFYGVRTEFSQGTLQQPMAVEDFIQMLDDANIASSVFDVLRKMFQ